MLYLLNFEINFFRFEHLPTHIQKQLTDVHNAEHLSHHQKHEKFRQIISGLSDDLRWKLPPIPPTSPSINGPKS